MIIDLDSESSDKPKKIEVIKPSLAKKETKPVREDISNTDRNGFLISQIEMEEKEVRYARALSHRKYRDLLNDKMEPKGSVSDFLVVYDEIEAYTNQLKDLWMRKEHIRHFGSEQKSRVIDDATMSKIDALKYDRGRVSDNLYKAKKQLTVAKASGNLTKEANASAKIDKLQFRYLEIQTTLKKLEDV
jgi:hypothetical protein